MTLNIHISLEINIFNIKFTFSLRALILVAFPLLLVTLIFIPAFLVFAFLFLLDRLFFISSTVVD